MIGPQQGAGPRPIIMDQQQLLAIFNGGGDAVAQETTQPPSPDAGEAEGEGDLFNMEEPQ